MRSMGRAEAGGALARQPAFLQVSDIRSESHGVGVGVTVGVDVAVGVAVSAGVAVTVGVGIIAATLADQSLAPPPVRTARTM